MQWKFNSSQSVTWLRWCVTKLTTCNTNQLSPEVEGRSLLSFFKSHNLTGPHYDIPLNTNSRRQALTEKSLLSQLEQGISCHLVQLRGQGILERKQTNSMSGNLKYTCVYPDRPLMSERDKVVPYTEHAGQGACKDEGWQTVQSVTCLTDAPLLPSTQEALLRMAKWPGRRVIPLGCLHPHSYQDIQ